MQRLSELEAEAQQRKKSAEKSHVQPGLFEDPEKLEVKKTKSLNRKRSEKSSTERNMMNEEVQKKKKKKKKDSVESGSDLGIVLKY